MPRGPDARLVRASLVERLRSRRGEIEEAIMVRVNAVSNSSPPPDPVYRDGLRSTVTAALDYGLEAVGRGWTRPTPIPTVLIDQARLAARNKVGLDTVLRRYLAGYTLLGDFIVEEAERETVDGTSLKRLLRSQAAVLDHVLTEVSEEYGREERRPASVEERRVESVQRLLDGEFLDDSHLGYEFTLRHLGIVGSGAGAEAALRDIASSLGCRLMLLRPDTDIVWAWLGSRRLDSEAVTRTLERRLSAGSHLALGELAEGIAGWRLTHRQAKATLPLAHQGDRRALRYVEVALVVSMSRDDLLLTSLREIYLRPLQGGCHGASETLRILRAYFEAGRNATSAAAALGLSRQTISRRLAEVEECLGRPLNRCAPELEAVLTLQDHRIDDGREEGWAVRSKALA
jgi:hypothetical protein